MDNTPHAQQYPRILNPHQAQTREPTASENALGDALERAFASGITDLEPLVAALNAERVMDSNGQAWTTSSFCAQIKLMAME